MLCPNCGARIKLKSDMCVKCGTKLCDIKDASFQMVKKVRKEYQPDLIVYSTAFPKDLSYKKTLLFCIFLGWMGGHLYYTQRYFKAIMLSVLSGIFLICIFPIPFYVEYGSVGFLTPLTSFLVNSQLYLLPSALGAITIILWVFDFIKILTRHFPVPVVLPEKKK